MSATRHRQRCIPCTGALVANYAPTWEDGPVLCSLMDSDGICLLGNVIPHERSVHAVSYKPERRYLGEYPTIAEAKEAVEQAAWA